MFGDRAIVGRVEHRHVRKDEQAGDQGGHAGQLPARSLAKERRSLGQARRREQHEERDQWEAIARVDEKQHDARSVGQPQRIEIQRRRRSNHVTHTPNAASGTSRPKFPTIAPIRTSGDHSA